MIEAKVQHIFDKFLGTKTVHCQPEPQSIDDPSFAHLDPHAKFDDNDVDPTEAIVPFQNRGRKPPAYEALMNSVKSISKKYEHIKGFKFEVGMAMSNNFHLTSTWQVRPPIQNQMKMGYRSNAGFTLAAQYIGGELKSPADTPTIIMTGRLDSAGKLESSIIKKLNDMHTLRLNAYFHNSDINYSQVHLDWDLEGTHTHSSRETNSTIILKCQP